MQSRLLRLKRTLKELKSVVVAYSGGVDSTFLLKVALDTLGRENVLAVTARSETYPSSEYNYALRMAGELKAPHITIITNELDLRDFRRNPINRCYYCKKELFKKLSKLANHRGLKHVVDGANIDDLKDLRFGMEAARELGVRSPLIEASIGKVFIRRASKKMGLRTWSKPSFACLASRFPYYENIDKKALKKIDSAEYFLRNLSLRQARVRVHKHTARIEVEKADFKKVLKFRESIVKKFKQLGFVYVTLDLEGYRTGSMNEPYLLTKKCFFIE